MDNLILSNIFVTFVVLILSIKSFKVTEQFFNLSSLSIGNESALADSKVTLILEATMRIACVIQFRSSSLLILCGKFNSTRSVIVVLASSLVALFKFVIIMGSNFVAGNEITNPIHNDKRSNKFDIFTSVVNNPHLKKI